MHNVIPDGIKTGDKPISAGKSQFPYENVIKTLLVLDSTKCVILTEKECNQNRLTYIRLMMKKHNGHRIGACRKDGHVYLWLNK